MQCNIYMCKNKQYCKDVCSRHYQRIKRYGRHDVDNSQKANGLSRSAEYRVYKDMKARCYNKSIKSYGHYGGRGIKVCDRWLASFNNFLHDMGNRPDGKYSIDRVDNDGDYEPTNCKWSTQSEQRRNSRVLNSKSGIRGVVYYEPGRKHWRAEMTINYKRYTFGYYKTIEEAANARRAGEIRLGY